MKAISLRPDYALDVLTGEKTKEYRTWNTKHRGDLLICSTARKLPGTIPSTALCVVELTNVKELANHTFCWELDNLRFINPFKVKGQQGFYYVDDSLIKFRPDIDEDSDQYNETKADSFFNDRLDPLFI